jgi:hypothetical protein
MSCEIIQFSAAPRRSIKTSTRVGEDIGDSLPAEIDFRSSGWKARKAERAANRSATAINSDLRKERKDVWRAAEAATRYWRARLEFEDAVSWAQMYDAPEGHSHPDVDTADRNTIVASWRAALGRQILTRAWDANSVKWKQDTFAKGQHKRTDVNPKKIERSIADDLAWLAAHPTKRTGNVEACAERRAFKEAMRQRVREIAASRDLSDEVIRPVLKLKHEEVGRFCQTHGVNLGWLLEGVGPIFKAWPTS